MTGKMVQSMINLRWPIILPEHRAAREVNPFWEAHRLAAMYSRINWNWMPDTGDEWRKPRVLDIGAEEGDFPCLYSLWGAEVFLVEPNPKAWPWIKATFEANGQIPAGLFVGLLGSPGQVNDLETHGLRPGSRWPSFADDIEPVPDHGFHHLAEHATVSPIWTLDSMLDWSQPWVPDFITMDVEGGELHCLMGAEQTLREHRPELFISIHPEFMMDLYGQHPDELHALLEGFGYRGQFLCRDHEEHWHFVPREKPWPWSDPH